MEELIQEKKKWKYEMKPIFRERMEKLLPDKKDWEEYENIIHTHPKNFIRCNTIKITTDELMNRLSKKWKVIQPYKNHPEIILIDQNLGPGELGNAPEHILGYYYVQEISSMLSVLALNPEPGDLVLDLCASPGSKTTQIAAKLENKGTIIANDVKLDRIIILSSNLERCGAANTIISRSDGIAFCEKLKNSQFKFDKILVDAPCSGEGTLRSSPRTFQMWNPHVVIKFSKIQKRMVSNALKCLKAGGTLVYSTCTHSPEENEEVVSHILENFPVKIEDPGLPLKTRPGLTEWKDMKFHKDTVKAARIYPQDNDSEGFFVSKFTLLEEIR